MYRFTTYIAFFFLVLLFRVVAPDAAILALHQHQHTEHEHTFATDDEVSQAHIHCEVDEFDNTNFLSTDFSVSLSVALLSGCYLDPYSFAWKFTFPNNSLLRGPPVA